MNDHIDISYNSVCHTSPTGYWQTSTQSNNSKSQHPVPLSLLPSSLGAPGSKGGEDTREVKMIPWWGKAAPIPATG